MDLESNQSPGVAYSFYRQPRSSCGEFGSSVIVGTGASAMKMDEKPGARTESGDGNTCWDTVQYYAMRSTRVFHKTARVVVDA
jgi:hypothetical protein